MVEAVKSAVEEARAKKAQEREEARQQQEADERFALMFQDCATLLESDPKSRITHLGRRIIEGLSTKAVSLLFPRWFYLRGISLSDLGDTRKIVRSLNGTGESIPVTLESHDAVPSRSGSSINLQIPNLAEILKMNRRYAEIYRGEQRTVIVLGEPYNSGFVRRANLIDAARYQPVVTELTQPHA